MTGEIHRLRDRSGESEKITINVGFVDLGHIDLLVREGFYSNRTDFIRTAIRNQLASHADAVKQSIVRRTLELGLRRFSREELEAVKAQGGRLNIQVVGLAEIAEDVTPESASTISSIAPATLRALALHSRMTFAEGSRNWIRYCTLSGPLSRPAPDQAVLKRSRKSA